MYVSVSKSGIPKKRLACVWDWKQKIANRLLVEVSKCTFEKPISDKKNQQVRLNSMESAQTVGDDSNSNVYTERRLWLQIHSYGFLKKGEKYEDRFPCFALAAENMSTCIISG